MPTLRIALAQDNPTVGDLDGNAELIRSSAATAHKAGVDLLVTGELSLCGYPVEDLALRHTFIQQSRELLMRLAGDLQADGYGDLPVTVGYLDADGPIGEVDNPTEGSRGIRNALALLYHGKVVFQYFKHHLPNYGVFDEDRYFVAGNNLHIARISGVDIAFTICEDLWQEGVPFQTAQQAHAGLVISSNASPYEKGKMEQRFDLLRRRAVSTDCPIAYLNIVGGQDELVFDGGSMIVDQHGELVANATRFDTDMIITDLDLPPADDTEDVSNQSTNVPMSVTRHYLSTEPRDDKPANTASNLRPSMLAHHEIWEALRLGLGDYVRKNGFESVLLGLSGGIDSAVTAALARDALGPDNVWAIAMPSQNSSQHSLDDAADLADRTGINYTVEPIQATVDAVLSQLALSGLALENLQARIRGVLLMSLSNQHGHLVLAPGNKSEYAVGYSTLYGDSVGGFAPIKDVPKTLIYDLATWRNEHARNHRQTEPVPDNIITKAPSAELRPDQVDQDSLPNYDVLDAVLDLYVDQDVGRSELVDKGYDAELVTKITKLVDGSEYKRRQTPPGTKISAKSFGKDRRLPITNRFRG
ncbi:NAD+ synthase [Haloglycomyces albus]|uniref:NAD+ synthase n=1 Tax=Haloglycomyces albus TaxID=526067 RepID=UPI00046D7EDE|nr:NAD+ synthase [Haloglycomyces albus]